MGFITKQDEELARRVRDAQPVIADYPEPGIRFVDLWGLTRDPQLTQEVAEWMAAQFHPSDFDLVLAPEARGFIFGQLLAYVWSKPFVPARKPGKLPRRTVSAKVQLEYGATELQVHADDIPANARVLIVDDLFATGGTVLALVELLETELNATAAGVLTVNALDYLDHVKLPDYCPVKSLVHYDRPPHAVRR